MKENLQNKDTKLLKNARKYLVSSPRVIKTIRVRFDALQFYWSFIWWFYCWSHWIALKWKFNEDKIFWHRKATLIQTWPLEKRNDGQHYQRCWKVLWKLHGKTEVFQIQKKKIMKPLNVKWNKDFLIFNIPEFRILLQWIFHVLEHF